MKPKLADESPSTIYRPHTRWMIRRDMPEVLEIEARTGGRWLEPDFLARLRHRNCIGMVCACGESVVGFVLFELYRDYLEIVRLAVHPEWQRIDLGQLLIEKLKAKLSTHRRTELRCTVSENNLGGLMFLKANGFMATDIVRQDDEPDSYLMRYTLALPEIDLGGEHGGA